MLEPITDYQHLYEGECAIYQPFLTAGKPQIQLEYHDKNPDLSACDATVEGVGMALYNTVLLDANDITLSCPK
jgi:hypothetical protein